LFGVLGHFMGFVGLVEEREESELQVTSFGTDPPARQGTGGQVARLFFVQRDSGFRIAAATHFVCKLRDGRERVKAGKTRKPKSRITKRNQKHHLLQSQSSQGFGLLPF